MEAEIQKEFDEKEQSLNRTFWTKINELWENLRKMWVTKEDYIKTIVDESKYYDEMYKKVLWNK